MAQREAVRSALALLTPCDRRFLIISAAMQMGSSRSHFALRPLGVVLIGLTDAFAVIAVLSGPALATAPRQSRAK